MEAISEIEPTPGFDKGQALYRCSEGTSIGPVPGALVADGARSDEEDAVLQNLRKLLE